MTSTPSRTSLGEYCAARDETTVTFATPAYRRRDRFYTSAFFFGMFIIFLGSMIYVGVLNPSDFEHHSLLAILTICFPFWFFLSIAIVSYQSAGVNVIVFDLERRIYERILCAEAPFTLDNRGKIYGLGHTFKRRCTNGDMSEIIGIRIITRRMGGGKAPKYQGNSLNLMWRNAKQPPMIIGFALSEDEVWDIATAISEILDLPVLQIDRADSWATLARETRLQTTSPVPVNIMGASRPRTSSQDVNGFFPSATRRKASPRNVYLAQFDGKTAVFRRPIRQVVLNLFLGAFFYAIPVVLTILHLERWKTYDVPTLIMAVPLVLLGSILVFSSGRSEIVFDLGQRTYRRRLPPKFPGASEDIVGGGLPFGRKVVTGFMSEIEGIKVLARETSDYSHCAVRLIWADNALPPCVVCYTRNVQDAHLQALEIGLLLRLPMIPTRKPVNQPDVPAAPKQYNRW